MIEPLAEVALDLSQYRLSACRAPMTAAGWEQPERGWASRRSVVLDRSHGGREAKGKAAARDPARERQRPQGHRCHNGAGYQRDLVRRTLAVTQIAKGPAKRSCSAGESRRRAVRSPGHKVLTRRPRKQRTCSRPGVERIVSRVGAGASSEHSGPAPGTAAAAAPRLTT